MVTVVDTKEIVSLMAYLTGVKRTTLENTYLPDIEENFFENLDKNKYARAIRSVSKLRTTLMLRFSKVENKMRYELKNLNTIDYFSKDDIKWLEKNDFNILKANYRASNYITDFNNFIRDNIENCKDLFPSWVKWEYIKDLFIVPNIQKEEVAKKEFALYMGNIPLYPYQAYIHWTPEECGNLFYNDKKFLSTIYSQHKDYFQQTDKVTDADESTKTSIYDFISQSNGTVIVVDCENSDVYKLYSTIKGLNSEELEKVEKIILYDDSHTTSAWQLFSKVVDIEVEYKEVKRVTNLKSLVDIEMTAGTCKEYYQNNVKSFIIVSSDSDYWGLISSLPDADFLVMYEYSKCGSAIKTAWTTRNIFNCSIDDFCSGNIDDFKHIALTCELKNYIDTLPQVNAFQLLDNLYEKCRIDAGEAEKTKFYNRYLKTLKLVIDGDGNYKIEVASRK